MKRFLVILLVLWLTKYLPEAGCIYAIVLKASNGIGDNTATNLLYILPNKDVYEAGEDLWFKAWQFEEETMSLSDRSRTLYLRLYSPSDSVVWDEMYPMRGGRSDGHVYVGENWMSGEYYMEGYTKSSFHSDSIAPTHSRKILVVNRIAAIDSLTQSLSVTDSLQGQKDFRFGMYPEGGSTVYGITSKVAFKATDGRGFPVDVEGCLTDNGEVVSRFKSYHDGMGLFVLCPQQGHTYKAVLSDGKEFPLPPPLQAGLALTLIKQDTTAMRFLVMQPSGAAAQNVKLTAKMRGILCCEARGAIRDSLVISLPMKHFSLQGIAEVTLFDGNGQPVCERLVYVNPQKSLRISVKANEWQYYRRNEGKLGIHVTDDAGHPVQAELCVSLFDKRYQSDRVRETMLSYCNLSSQVRGNIHNPLYYFDSKNTDRQRALDLLLLTQGWRRYSHHLSVGCEILADGIQGKVLLGKKRKSDAESIQAIQVSGHDGRAILMWTDTLGRFTLPPETLQPMRGGYVYVKPLATEGQKPQVELFPSSQRIADARARKFKYELLYKNAKPMNTDNTDIVTGFGTHMLQGVTVTAKRGKVFTDKMTGKLDSMAQNRFTTAWVCKHNYLNDFLSGYTDPLCHPSDSSSHIPENGKLYLAVKFRPSEKYSGYYIAEDQRLVTYQTSKFTEEQLMKMNNISRVKGYYGEREFYQPDKSELVTDLPDARNALLWLPSVMTDENGKTEIPFLTSDDTGIFVGIVEGTDGNGLLGSGTFEIDVKKYAY